MHALHLLAGDPYVAELYDFGNDGSSYWLVMRRHPCSLRDWARGAVTLHGAATAADGAADDVTNAPRAPPPLDALLDAYREVLAALERLHERRVAHYDVKAANFLCGPAPTPSATEPGGGGTHGAVRRSSAHGQTAARGGQACGPEHGPQRMRLVVADFGVATVRAREPPQHSPRPPSLSPTRSFPPVRSSSPFTPPCSQVSPVGSSARTPRSRGTECIKSPEMLLIGKPTRLGADADTGGRADADADGRGCGQLCDVWSVGCLLYEMLTGEHLFGADNWTTFYVRLTDPSQPLLTEARLGRLPPAHAEPIAQFLAAVLQREPGRRPVIAEVICLFATLRAAIATGITDGRTSPPVATSVPRVAAPPRASWVPPLVEARAAPAETAAALAGVARLGSSLLLGPRRALGCLAALQAMHVGQIVCCGLEPPTLAAHGGIHCVHLDAPIASAAAAATVRGLAKRAAVGGRATLVVGDEGDASRAAVAAALLELTEGLSPFEAATRVRHAIPAAAV